MCHCEPAHTMRKNLHFWKTELHLFRRLITNRLNWTQKIPDLGSWGLWRALLFQTFQFLTLAFPYHFVLAKCWCICSGRSQTSLKFPEVNLKSYLFTFLIFYIYFNSWSFTSACFFFPFNKHICLQPLIIFFSFLFFLFKTTKKCTAFYEFKLKMKCSGNDLQAL